MELTKTLFYGSIPMALISLAFFIYSSIELSDFTDDDKAVCHDFMKYNIIHLGLLISSILVFSIYMCCGNCIASILFIGNAVLIVGQLIEKYTNKDERCNAECRGNCTELVEFSDKINICLISNGGVILLVALILIYSFTRFILCCK
jgi:hypothetical protein